ncbi:hypothetical protein L1987_25067 [Smallanthus sonchifolius]|uniref:Uncharacterized protein n=1 Tax=Smallanthus sonchifolius TaxID=185202 RepID=A0ACB9IM80_9ASTR|nr:hypothetical protein L1987_25067 [Smallanthus sonchifolius]
MLVVWGTFRGHLLRIIVLSYHPIAFPPGIELLNTTWGQLHGLLKSQTSKGLEACLANELFESNLLHFCT